MSAENPLIARTAALIPLLAANAAEADQRGQLSADVVKELHGAGLFSLQAPRAVGGHEADFRTAFEVYRLLGRGCASSAWTAAVLSAGSFLASLYGARARADVWGVDPRAGVASRLVPEGQGRPVEGGLIVSGRWRFMSGIHQSEWAIVAVSSAASDESLMALLPVDQGSVERSWDVTGLRATGSDSIVFEDVFVPEHRLLSLVKMLKGGRAAGNPEEPLYGGMVLNLGAVALIGPLLGVAEAALERVLTQLKLHAPAGASAAPGRAEQPSVRAAVAEAASRIDTARMRVSRVLDDLELSVATASQADPLTRARGRMDAGAAAENLREAVRLLMAALGSRAFASTEPVQRAWRDVEIALSHVSIVPEECRDAYGQALLGEVGAAE
jgi:alkylation response protein AidB-like acyl-CoA dehydrogenase